MLDECPVCEEDGINMADVIAQLAAIHFPGIDDVTEKMLCEADTGSGLSVTTQCLECHRKVTVTFGSGGVSMVGPV